MVYFSRRKVVAPQPFQLEEAETIVPEAPSESIEADHLAAISTPTEVQQCSFT